MENLFEIRIHSRGGQGAKTIGQILAEAGIEDGKFVEAFAEYGPERTGAPMQVFVRISSAPIRVHSNIRNPDMVILADPTLLGIVDITAGLKKNGSIIVNTAKSYEEIIKLLKFSKSQKIYPHTNMLSEISSIQKNNNSCNNKTRSNRFSNGVGVYPINATKIAVEVLGKDFSGIVLMGALNKIAGIVSKEALEEELAEIFARKKGKEMAEKNILAFRKGYEAVEPQAPSNQCKI